MSDAIDDAVVFDEMIVLALAESSGFDWLVPPADMKQRILLRLHEPPAPEGFGFRFEREGDWIPHPVPGIRMKVLALNKERGYATLLLDVAPGTRFPPHHHTGGDEECFIVSGSAYTCGRRLGPGDFVHADAETDHGELWTDEGCRVILVVPPEDYMPAPGTPPT